MDSLSRLIYRDTCVIAAMCLDNPYESPAAEPSVAIALRVPWKSLAFAALWGAAILNLFHAGTIPDGYRIHVLNETPPFPYPWQGVIRIAMLMGFQASIFYLILRPESFRLQFARLAGALGLNFCMLLFFGVFAMHAPPYFGWQLAWLLLHGIALVCLLIIAGAFKARSA